jgi:GT2 family glycosyltransferase
VPTRLCIVIVNYRTAPLVAECLRSIAEQAANLGGMRVVVADNASGDDSTSTLGGLIEREGWGGWVSLLALPRNGGFAAGNNAAIGLATGFERPDYFVLLNPDTICRPGAIGALVDFMESHPRAGIAGSRLEDASGAPAHSAHNFFSPLGELEAGARLGILSRALGRFAVTPPAREQRHECGWVSGAALAVRASVFKQIGLFDEGFFLYFEEVDFCARARKAGWQVWHVPESRVVHFEGAATGIQDARRRRAPYWYHSRRRYFVKHHGVAGLLMADALWALGRGSLALRRALGLGSGDGAPEPRRFAADLLWGDLRALVDGEVWGI